MLSVRQSPSPGSCRSFHCWKNLHRTTSSPSPPQGRNINSTDSPGPSEPIAAWRSRDGLPGDIPLALVAETRFRSFREAAGLSHRNTVSPRKAHPFPQSQSDEPILQILLRCIRVRRCSVPGISANSRGKRWCGCTPNRTHSGEIATTINHLSAGVKIPFVRLPLTGNAPGPPWETRRIFSCSWEGRFADRAPGLSASRADTVAQRARRQTLSDAE